MVNNVAQVMQECETLALTVKEQLKELYVLTELKNDLRTISLYLVELYKVGKLNDKRFHDFYVALGNVANLKNTALTKEIIEFLERRYPFLREHFPHERLERFDMLMKEMKMST